MERNYLEDFPIDDTEHKIVCGKSDYVNKFFHEIDLKYILEKLDELTVDDIRLTNDGLSVQLLLNGEVQSTINLTQPVTADINIAKVALQNEIDLVKGRVTIVETGITDLNTDLKGLAYYPAPTNLVGYKVGDELYTDLAGKYILADSDTGIALLADTDTYKIISYDKDLRGVRGADSVVPFSSGSGNGPSSELDINDNFELTVIDFLNDDRFECSNNGYPWTQQNLFTYNGVNMWSPPYVPDGTTGSEYIKNVSGKTIYFRLAGGWETEGQSYDWLTAAINNWTILGPRGGNPEDYVLGSIYSLSDGDTLTVSYRKDGSGAAGKDRVGIIMYEVGGDV